ncbi:MAG TPA: response regulator transcription factor [Alphaproteobacteria bacterium]|nr:response regulator transcription factor [Alphaproteobacteria bacterium]
MTNLSEQSPPQGHVVLVDDDELFRESLGQNLIDAGFSVVSFGSGETALDHLLNQQSGDIVLLDWKMPEMNGIEVLRRMRAAGLQVPVIFLTVLTDQIYEEAALQGGAVDFVEKSRSFAILLRRMTLILSGLKGGKPESLEAASAESEHGTAVLHRGALELRRETSRAFWKGQEVPLSITEFKMVDLLATRAGQDVRYRELYDLVHGEGFMAGYGAEGYRSNVRAFVKRIRQKFRDVDTEFDEIENYSGFGYRWRDREAEDT